MTPPTTSLEYLETAEAEDQGQWSEARPLKDVLQAKSISLEPRYRRSRRPRANSQRVLLRGRLRRMKTLRQGWDGYDAEPPSQVSYLLAKFLLRSMFSHRFLPDRIAPAVVGGIGISAVRRDREVYVEVSNAGSVHAVFSQGAADPTIKSVELSERALADLIAEMRAYLNG